MKIVYVTEFFSEKMGYSENCLPKAMASLGQEVHVVASELQIYGNTPDYDEIYGRYLGPRVQPCGETRLDGFTLHRLPHRMLLGYTDIRGLLGTVGSLSPDIVQTINCVSSNTLKVALGKPWLGYAMFTECHQHISIVQPFLREAGLFHPRRVPYFLTRTLPGRFASFFSEKCFPIAPDCAEVARRFYGVPERKIRLMSLGTDTERFHPPAGAEETAERRSLREELGIREGEVACIYTGRFSADKNPLLLALAVAALNERGLPFRALFLGGGPQREEIAGCRGSVVVPFVPFPELARYYRAADVGVWPTQESTSMLDAASAGLPIVAGDRVGAPERVRGNGALYREGDVEDLARVLEGFVPEETRKALGAEGRRKMIEKYSWLRIAGELLAEYEAARR